MHESLTMLAVVTARRTLDTDGSAWTLQLVRPPYPALGVGTLRVLRVCESGEARFEMLAGYDQYERLP